MPLYDNVMPTVGYQSVNAGVVPQDVYGIAINWFSNRTPLATRLPSLPIGAYSFGMTNDNFRQRSQLLNAAFTDTSGTTLTTFDTSMYMIGDVIEVESEQMLVTAIPSATTLTVTRGYEGTTAATHLTALPAYLIGRAATGADVDLVGLSRIAAMTQQFVEVVQHAYQVGGALEASSNWMGAYSTPLQRDRMQAMQHVLDDFETSCYYGAGRAMTSTDPRQVMKGLRTIITTNKTTAPTNASAYKPTDLLRDTVQKCYDNGGNPGLFIVSSDFMTGLSMWGIPLQRLDAGATAFGTPINLFLVPFIGGLNLIPAPLLRPGTAICLSMPEVRLRMRRNLFEIQRGVRGDATEGDFVMDGAIELDNEAHHAWVSGITNFAAA